MKTKAKRPRLYGKKRYKMPQPCLRNKDDNGFSLRTIQEADSRYHVVKQMRKRVEQLMEDVGADTVAKEWLAGRAVFLVGYLESLEVDALEGTVIDWQRYIQATRALTDVLKRLGLDREVRSAKRLEAYIAEAKNGKKR